MIARDGETYDGIGWKFLSPNCTTEYQGVEFAYPTPAPGKVWSEWFAHPNPALADGYDCGPGRLHVMRKLDARYAPKPAWWPWFVQYRDVIGSSVEKVGVRELRLRRVNKHTFWRIIRLGWCMGANLRDADLRGAEGLADREQTDAFRGAAGQCGRVRNPRVHGLQVISDCGHNFDEPSRRR